MLRQLVNTGVLLGFFSVATVAVTAQEVVHALSGTISSVDSAAKTITVLTDDGSDGTFKDMTNSKTSIEFDKHLRAGSTPATAFKDKQGRSIVFYFGNSAIRTAVALRDMGPGPFEVSTGLVTGFNKGSHSISIKPQTGPDESFKIVSETVADTGSGAVEGLKFEADKGNQVRVVSANQSGTQTALFIIVLAIS